MAEAFPKAPRSFLRPLAALAGGSMLVLLALWQAGVFVPGKIAPGHTSVSAPPFSGTPAVVEETEVPRMEYATGTVRSRDEVEVSARIVARVVEVRVRSGDRVDEGEVLVKLDDTDLAAARQEAAEAVRQAEAALDLAAAELKRMQGLYQRDAVPRQRLDQAVAEHRQARALHSQATQALRRAEAMLSHATLRSPMAGVVSERLADPGDMAQAGRDLLRVFDPDRLLLEVPVSESLLPRLELGRPVSFRLHIVPGAFSGTLEEIVPSVDPGSRTFIVKVCITESLKTAEERGESPRRLVPGMSGVLALSTGTRRVVTVPEAAVARIGQMETVRVLEDGQARLATVQTIPLPETFQGAGAYREVLSGLEAGQTVLAPTP